MKRFLLGLAALGRIGTAAVRAGVWMLEYERPCRQPCAVPGCVEDPDATGSNKGELRPACPLIELRLDLADSKPVAGRMSSLFCRARLENRSCLALDLDAINFIMPHWGKPCQLRVFAPGGGVVKEGHRQEDVAFYDDVPETFARFRQQTGLRVGGYGNVRVPPGQGFYSQGNVLHPYRTEYCEISSEEYGWDGSGTCLVYDVPVPKGMKPPPQGYAAVDGYLFPKPGRYSAQFVCDQHGVHAQPIHPYARFVPQVWRAILYYGDYLKPRKYLEYHSRVESNVAFFEVRPAMRKPD